MQSTSSCERTIHYLGTWLQMTRKCKKCDDTPPLPESAVDTERSAFFSWTTFWGLIPGKEIPRAHGQRQDSGHHERCVVIAKCKQQSPSPRNGECHLYWKPVRPRRIRFVDMIEGNSDRLLRISWVFSATKLTYISVTPRSAAEPTLSPDTESRFQYRSKQ